MKAQAHPSRFKAHRRATRPRAGWKLPCLACGALVAVGLLLFFLDMPLAHADDLTFGDPRPFGPGVRSVTTGDMDGDGDLDLVVGKNGQDAIYLNDGTGSFDWTDAVRGFGGGPTAGLAVGDVDGDGDLDVVAEGEGGQGLAYLNDGAANLHTGAVDCSNPPANARCFGTDTDTIYSLALGDVNGDGSLDIAAGTDGQSVLYMNDGAGGFYTGTVTCAAPPANARCFGSSTEKTYGLALGDVDGDGSLDIAAGTGGQNVVYLNDGAGGFAYGPPNCGDPDTSCFGNGTDWTTSVALGDMDGDGNLDLAAGQVSQQSALYLNDGFGDFDWVGAERPFGPTWEWTASLALGDIDGDGDLDPAAGNSGSWVGGQNVVYLNDGAANLSAGPTFGSGADYTNSVAAADLDGDGDLDLAVGNNGPSIAYLNDGASDLSNSRIFGTGNDYTKSVAVGDLDGDGALDLVVGNVDAPLGAPLGQNALYLNDGTGQFVWPGSARDFGPPSDTTLAVAVGDVDGDGSLDIVTGNQNQQNTVYLNDGAGSFYSGTLDCAAPPANTRCFGTGSDATYSVAIGDVNGDGALDLAVGNKGAPNVVYLNDGSGNFYSGALDCAAPPANTRCFGTGSDATNSVVMGDVDGDGDLDLAVGNTGQNAVYLNDSTGAFHYGPLDCSTSDVRCFGPSSGATYSLALGDVDGSGDLDIVTGNSTQQNVVYLNEGGGSFFAGSVKCDSPTTRCFGTGGDNTHSVQTGDVDGDGDVDLVAGNYHERSQVYLNEGDGQFSWSSPARAFEAGFTEAVALGDLDGDGLLDLAAGNTGDLVGNPNRIFLNRSLLGKQLSATISRPGLTPDADFFSAPEILDSQTIPIMYTLSEPEGRPARFVRTYYSLDGGGSWRLAIGASGTVTVNLTTSLTGTSHVFTWDTFASGFFGQSDNVVFRVEVYPGLQPYTGTVAGPYQWPYASVTTFPFRVRGTQVQVVSGTAPVSNALVYRIPAGQASGGPIANSAGDPFHTDHLGYLQGRGTVAFGDTLVALLPISTTEAYTVYATNATPTATGLEAHTVAAPGVQTLVVSSTHPLILFDLNVSLEWDARNDDLFMTQLAYDLQRASALLYDWTDGQAALGSVTIYHDRDHWNEAHVRIYATNRMRPSAAQGGISSDVISDTDVLTLTYGPGQVHIGAVWNRYGEPTGSLGEDWPRTLAHELGHYALFLDDNYLGLDENGLLIPVAGCTGAMSDPYRADYPYDELHAAADWLPSCAQTLSHQIAGRSDWQTVETFYPWLDGTHDNAGPSSLPLAVTRIALVEPVTPPTTLEDPTFYLVDAGGSQVQPGASARAFLFQDNRLTDLGRPTLDRVLARGARPGDRLCVYELSAGRLGCEDPITAVDEQLALNTVTDWEPDLAISPITSRTIGITVTNVGAGLVLQARLYPLNGPASGPVTLTETAEGYTAVLTAAEPAPAGYVHVQVVSPTTPLREIVTDYALGGNPGHMRGSRIGYRRNRQAPAVSADGQVILFGDMDFDEGAFFTLQAATVVKGVPAWMTTVGHPYRLVGSPNAPDLSGASISFAYLGGEVPLGQEDWIKVYYQSPLSATWQVLPTRLDTYHNTASAPVQGEGLYVLMTSIQIPLYGPGWNLFAYPVPGTRPVPEALLSISGTYGMVYGYQSTDPADPWKLYAPTVPPWVNDLDALQFGHGYWISVTQPITLHLRGPEDGALDAAAGLPMPPATFYGLVQPGPTFSPAAGMTLTARIDGRLCGQSALVDVAGYGVAYTVDVMADDGGAWAGCGAPGREVTFRAGTQSMVPAATWSNDRVWDLPLRPPDQYYLPLVLRSPTWGDGADAGRGKGRQRR